MFEEWREREEERGSWELIAHVMIFNRPGVKNSNTVHDLTLDSSYAVFNIVHNFILDSYYVIFSLVHNLTLDPSSVLFLLTIDKFTKHGIPGLLYHEDEGSSLLRNDGNIC